MQPPSVGSCDELILEDQLEHIQRDCIVHVADVVDYYVCVLPQVEV